MILKHPITGKETHAQAVEWLRGAAYFRCGTTGLQWLDPLPEGVPVFPDFSSYADELLSSATPQSVAAAMTPYERAAFAWVLAHVPPKGKIVELFAESGRFAWRLRSQGYEVFVADPLPAHVAVLRRHGFTAAESARPAQLPSEWADADAVIVLESIVRLPEPGLFMASVRSRFPVAQIFITAPSSRRPLKLAGVDRRADYPPDFLTRWTTRALRELLQTNGCVAHGRPITPGLLSKPPNRTWRGQAYLVLLAALMFASGEYEFSVCAWGEPRS